MAKPPVEKKKKLPKRIQIFESSKEAKEAGGGFYKDKNGFSRFSGGTITYLFILSM